MILKFWLQVTAFSDDEASPRLVNGFATQQAAGSDVYDSIYWDKDETAEEARLCSSGAPLRFQFESESPLQLAARMLDQWQASELDLFAGVELAEVRLITVGVRPAHSDSSEEIAMLHAYRNETGSAFTVRCSDRVAHQYEDTEVAIENGQGFAAFATRAVDGAVNKQVISRVVD